MSLSAEARQDHVTIHEVKTQELKNKNDKTVVRELSQTEC